MKAGWQTKTLGEVCQLEYGKPLADTDRKPDGLYPVYGANGEKDRTDKYYYDNSTIIVGRKGSAGELNLTESKFWPLDVTYFVTFDKQQYDLQFLYYLLTTLDLPSLAKGVKPGINRNEVYSQVVKIAPLPEQQRIVSILDESFDGIATAKTNAEKNLRQARELFQTVLSRAVIGEITNEWRTKECVDKLNSETDLKELFYQIKEIKRKAPRSEETAGHESIIKVLPKEWLLTSIGSLFNLIDYRGKNPHRSKNGRRLITAKNIKMGYLSDEPITFVSEETYKKWMVRGFPKYGDIFFVTEGHTMGFVALNIRNDQFALAQRTITLQPAVPFSTNFFFYFMMSFYFQDLVKLNATGAAAVGMKASKFRSLPLPFPPIAEQDTIVSKLDALLTETQRLESIYQQKLTALDDLKKSLLHQAFSGEL
jgi:type I restriction enzyme, S subunit